MEKKVTIKCEVEYTIEYVNDVKKAVEDARRNILGTGWTTIHTKSVKVIETIEHEIHEQEKQNIGGQTDVVTSA